MPVLSMMLTDNPLTGSAKVLEWRQYCTTLASIIPQGAATQCFATPVEGMRLYGVEGICVLLEWQLLCEECGQIAP